MHCIYTDNMFYGYSAIGRYASDAPIGDSISDVTEYRKKTEFGYRIPKLEKCSESLVFIAG